MTLLSFNSFATISEVRFKALDQTAETQLCVAAAKGGVEAVESLAKSLNLDVNKMMKSVVCNDRSLRSFTRQFKQTAPQNLIAPVKANVTFKFVAADNATASEICTKAVTEGLSAVAVKRRDYTNVYCNGVSLTRFVRQYRS